jgi:50S ribosomal protein L16 3-hydroxylase
MPAGEFWREFAATHYTRQPFETDEPPALFTISSADLFRLLVSATAQRGSGPNGPRIRFYVGQRQVIADLADYLPSAADGSVDGYVARLERELGGEPYLLVIEHAQVSSRKVWKQLASFLAGLYGATGALPGRVDAEVFVGRYPHTIPGIHRELSGVFVSMIQGQKDILVWPPDAVGLPVGSGRYRDAATASRRLRCAPGRLVYWPAMHWHVGESASAGTAGLHIAVLEEPLTVRDLLTRTTELDAEVGARVPTGWLGGPHELALPPELEPAVDSVVAAYADRDAVRDRLVAGWLRRRTALGFSAVPPTRKIVLRPVQTLTRDGVGQIVVAPKDEGFSWIAADGRVGYARSVPALVPLIDRLNSGRPIMVAEALDLAAESRDRQVLLRVLTLLASWRALATSAAAPATAASQAAPASQTAAAAPPGHADPQAPLA